MMDRVEFLKRLVAIPFIGRAFDLAVEDAPAPEPEPFIPGELAPGAEPITVTADLSPEPPAVGMLRFPDGHEVPLGVTELTVQTEPLDVMSRFDAERTFVSAPGVQRMDMECVLRQMNPARLHKAMHEKQRVSFHVDVGHGTRFHAEAYVTQVHDGVDYVPTFTLTTTGAVAMAPTP